MGTVSVWSDERVLGTAVMITQQFAIIATKLYT